jgi:hypothetical protein
MKHILVFDYENVYMDLDDTIVINENVNVSVMDFIYRQKYIGKNIHLLSRHLGDIDSFLDRFRIPKTIFSSIINIKDGSPKSIYIQDNSIVIDPSLSERIEITSIFRNITAYDVDTCYSF